MIDIQLINKYIPEDIFSVVPREFFEDDLGHPDHDEYLLCGNYYEYYYALSKYYQPKSMLEIGVRRGYSMVFLIMGSDNIEQVAGWDIPTPDHDNYVQDCLNGLDEKILKYTKKDIKLYLKYCDSQKVNSIDDKCDLIHIDGCHEHDAKIHDLELTIGKSKVVIVDDYKCDTVGAACSEFLRRHLSKFNCCYAIDTLRGTLVLEQKE